MRPQEHCKRLNRRLRSSGFPGTCVRHVPGEGYYVAPRQALSSYGALGVGTEYAAHSMSLREAEAFVGGMCAALREMDPA